MWSHLKACPGWRIYFQTYEVVGWIQFLAGSWPKGSSLAIGWWYSLSSFSHGLFHNASHRFATASSEQTSWRACAQEEATWPNLRIDFHHLWCILFARRESLSSGHTQEEKMTLWHDCQAAVIVGCLPHLGIESSSGGGW